MGWLDTPKDYNDSYDDADCLNCDWSKQDASRIDVESHSTWNGGHLVRTTDH